MKLVHGRVHLECGEVITRKHCIWPRGVSASNISCAVAGPNAYA